jgi:hypothetical protein
MKVIKLDRRHNLYHKGYRYAFLVERFNSDSNRIEKAVKELEGWRWDCTFWGKSKMDKNKRYVCRPYYIGFKNESTATMAMLKF